VTAGTDMVLETTAGHVSVVAGGTSKSLLLSSTGATSVSSGGNVDVSAGAASNVLVRPAAATADGDGGAVSLVGGSGKGASKVGGDVVLQGAPAASGAGAGGIQLLHGDGTAMLDLDPTTGVKLHAVDSSGSTSLSMDIKAESDLVLQTVSGHVSVVAGGASSQMLLSAVGGVSLTSSSGAIRLDSSSEARLISSGVAGIQAKGSGNAEVKAALGSVLVSSVVGSISMTASNGDVILESGGNVDLRSTSSSGSVTFHKISTTYYGISGFIVGEATLNMPTALTIDQNEAAYLELDFNFGSAWTFAATDTLLLTLNDGPAGATKTHDNTLAVVFGGTFISGSDAYIAAVALQSTTFA